MSKKHFIALADMIREHNQMARNIGGVDQFTEDLVATLAHFCASMNANFNRERWLAYIAGECGPNGGRL